MESQGVLHGFASALIVDLRLDPVYAAKQLGHARPSLTLDTYSHLFDRPARREHARATRIVGVRRASGVSTLAQVTVHFSDRVAALAGDPASVDINTVGLLLMLRRRGDYLPDALFVFRGDNPPGTMPPPYGRASSTA